MVGTMLASECGTCFLFFLGVFLCLCALFVTLAFYMWCCDPMMAYCFSLFPSVNMLNLYLTENLHSCKKRLKLSLKFYMKNIPAVYHPDMMIDRSYSNQRPSCKYFWFSAVRNVKEEFSALFGGV